MAGRVGNWRDETASDLRRSVSGIEGLLPTISGELSDSQVMTVWESYLFVEKSIAFIRFEIDEENPGRFIKAKPYDIPDERQALRFALSHIVKGSEEFALGDFKRSLKELREGRNYLRILLRNKRRLKVRKARASRSS